MIRYKEAETSEELDGILQLQQRNVAAVLPAGEREREGFVTVIHSFAELKTLNEIERHVVAVDGTKVVGYLLAMTQASANLLPVLRPMFDIFRQLSFNEKRLADFLYLVVGQVCIDNAYRGTGLLDALYAFYRQRYQKKYAFVVTEIDASNQRSLKAHQRIGFREISRYTAPGSVLWVIVLWEWN